MNILAIGAHPDDIELGCGGMLLKAVKNGHDVFTYNLTKGSASGDSRQRVRELRESSIILKSTALRMTLILLTLIIITISSFNISFSQQEITNSSCNCVIFRMSGMQDYWIRDAQIKPMDLFTSKNQSLSLGLIMNSIGNDSMLVRTIQEGASKNLFELSINGWNFTDYTKLNGTQQETSLLEANRKMNNLFGNTSNVFIPPEDAFNDATIAAMEKVGLRVISNDILGENIFEIDSFPQKKVIPEESKGNKTIFHMPATINFGTDPFNPLKKVSIESILSNVTENIKRHGYAVIALSPKSFMKLDYNGQPTNILNQNEVNELSKLVDSILQRNIPIATFSKAAEIDEKTYTSLSCLPVSKIPSSDTSITSLRPPDPISLVNLTGIQCSMADIYNNYGKAIQEYSKQYKVSPASIASVIFVETQGVGYDSDERMIIRFEACAFNDAWGKEHPDEFERNFQCDRPNDKFRIRDIDTFAPYHGNSTKEWEVFNTARKLNEEAALKSISMGLGQIMGYNYDKIGYGSVKEMFEAMSTSLKSQLDGILFAASHKDSSGVSCLDKLKSNDYVGFAGCYNAAGQNNEYGSRLSEAAKAYEDVTKDRLFRDQ